MPNSTPYKGTQLSPRATVAEQYKAALKERESSPDRLFYDGEALRVLDSSTQYHDHFSHHASIKLTIALHVRSCCPFEGNSRGSPGIYESSSQFTVVDVEQNPDQKVVMEGGYQMGRHIPCRDVRFLGSIHE